MRTTALALLFAAVAVMPAAGQEPPPPVTPATQQAPPVQQEPAAQQAPPSTPATPAVSAGRVEIIEQILVKVNGEIITKTDLENRQVTALRQRAQQMSDEELKKAIASITPDILVEAVDEMLLLQRGKELGYKVTDEQFKRVIENIRKENKLESDEQFNAALKQEGMTIEQLRKNLERQMVINQVQQVEVAGKVGISDSEAQAYYAEHKDEFTTPPSITLRELLVSAKSDGTNVNVAVDDAAKAKAESLMARARAGESFAALVAEASDAPSKANGGLVGPLSAERARPGRAEAHRGPQAGRRQRGVPHRRRLRAAATRHVDPAGREVVRRGARRHRAEGVREQTQRRVRPVPREAAQPGHHRVEERGNAQDLDGPHRRHGGARQEPRALAAI